MVDLDLDWIEINFSTGDLRKEREKKAYKETTSQDINNIDTYETRTKVNTKKMVTNK